MNVANHPENRRRELAQIHIAIKDLGLDDETYRAILWAVARVKSAADLDAHGRQRVLAHFLVKGWKSAKTVRHPGRPHNMTHAARGPQIKKIEALLADASRPWAYADALARRLCKVERVGWCTPPQLGKVIAALSYDAKRRAQRKAISSES